MGRESVILPVARLAVAPSLFPRTAPAPALIGRVGESGLLRRTNRLLLVALAVVFLAAGLLGFQRQAAVSALPEGLVLPAGIFPATFGGLPVADRGALEFLVEGFPAGRPVTMTAVSGAACATVVPRRAHDRSYLAVTLISGLFFWGMAVLAFVPRFNQPAVPQFFWITLLYGTGVLVGGVYFQAGWAPLGLTLSLFQLVSLALLPVVFVHLSLIFPVRRPLLGRSPGVPWGLYLLAAGLVCWQGFTLLRHFADPGPATHRDLALPQIVADVVMILEATGGIALLVRQERHLGPGRERQQVRWLLLGFVLGAAPYVFLRNLPQLLSLPTPFPVYLDRIFEPAIPLAMTFTIVRYRFLDIDIILKRGILYGILAGLLVLPVLLPVAIVGPGWTGNWSPLEKVLPVAGGLAAGLLFLPLRRRLGRWIDRTFFKIEHHADVLARDLGRGLARAASQEEVVQLLHQGITAALDPVRLAVGVMAGERMVTEGQGFPAGCPGSGLEVGWGTGSAGRVLAADQSTTNPEVERDDYPPDLLGRGFVLAVPLEVDHLVQGGVYVGPKNTGHRFVASEIGFLENVVEQASRRLQAVVMVQRVVEERLARQQLDELGRLKDDFLSRVAHDLRTPVTSLGWSLRNLLDGLAGELNPRQAEYLDAMNQAVAHLDRLVAGLLEISRLEKTEVKLALVPVDLGLVVRQAVGTVRPLAQVRGVVFTTAAPAGVSTVLANADKLAEALVNLLANAVRYSPDGAAVEVTVDRTGTGRVALTVRDHGPGLVDVGDPFARFAQGRPSPHGGGGYGLGLTIAREYLDLMGGTIAAGNHSEGGAVFRLELAAAPGQPEEASLGA